MSAAAPAGLIAASPRGDVLSWITTTDHKRIGILYLTTSLLYFGVAGVLALVMRTQLARPANDFVGAHAYAELFTLHGTAMIFLFVAPFAFGLANFLLPLQSRCARHGVSAAQRDLVLDVLVRRVWSFSPAP